MSKERSLGTGCIQGGWEPKNGEPRQLPIYQSTTFKYTTSEQMGRLFDLEENGYFYTRLANPTNDAVASKICQLEGGVGAGSYLLCYIEYLPGGRPCNQLLHHIRRFHQPVYRYLPQDGSGVHSGESGCG